MPGLHRRFLPIWMCLLLLSCRTANAQNSQSNKALLDRIAELESKVAVLQHAVEELTRTRESAAIPVPDSPAPTAMIQPQAQQAPRETFIMPPELLPEIGKTGAEAGFLMAGSANPFHLNAGGFGAGFIDLPLFDVPRIFNGKVSYEILVGMSQSQTTFNTTSNVAQVANLAVLTAVNPNGGLQNVTAAVTGTGAAPFPVTESTLTRLRLLQVVPFSLKYTSRSLDRWRVRPYAVLGFGINVTIHSQNPARGTPATFGIRNDATLPPEILNAVKQLFGGQAPFGGVLVAGQIAQSPELEARGLPSGHGNLDFGLHAGAGFEYRISRNVSIGFDSRFNRIAGTPGSLNTYGSRIGFHF